jgi:hypothetical protein
MCYCTLYYTENKSLVPEWPCIIEVSYIYSSYRTLNFVGRSKIKKDVYLEAGTGGSSPGDSGSNSLFSQILFLKEKKGSCHGVCSNDSNFEMSLLYNLYNIHN